MSDNVKRAYDRSGRAAKSTDNRRSILAAARASFIEHGYAATSMSAIARQAGVHVDTVYALVGRKPQVIAELIEHALSGTDAIIPAEQRDYVAAIRAEPDARNKIAIYAAATRAMVERVAPLYVALRDAAGTDEVAAQTLQSFADRRAENMRDFVADVAAAAGRLAEGLSLEDAANAVWTTNSPELFATLVGHRGWTLDRYEQWITATWTRLLVP